MSDFHPQGESSPLYSLLESIGQGNREVCVSGLRGGSSSLTAAYALLESDAPALIVTPDTKSVRKVLRDLTFYFGGEKSEVTSRLFRYPALDVSPFESISPYGQLTALRMSSLAALLQTRSNAIVVAPVEALMERVIPRDIFSGRMFDLHVDGLLDRDEFAQELVEAGYSPTALTEDLGDFSLRGGIIDVFCPCYDMPVRIELDDIEIKSLRFFNPNTQVSKNHAHRVRICPARQIAFSDDAKKRFAKEIKILSDDLAIPKQRRDQLVEQVDSGISFPGIEFFLPLFFDRLDTLFDYIPRESMRIVLDPTGCEEARDKFETKAKSRHENAREAGKPACHFEDLYLTGKQYEQAMATGRVIRLGREAYSDNSSASILNFEVEDHEGLREEILDHASEPEPLRPLARRIRLAFEANGRCAIVCNSITGADRMERMLSDYPFRAKYEPDMTFREFMEIPPGSGKVPILTGDLSEGFSFPDKQLLVICEEEVFGQKRRSEKVSKFRGEAIASFADLGENDYVVHVVHGVGIYRKLVQIEIQGIPGEFLLLEYARGDKLYLPVHRLAQVHRYVGAGASPVVDRLGSQTWEKAKAKARIAARSIAKELLALYAKRASLQGFAFTAPDKNFAEFESTFPFDETPDQFSAIQDVIKDMTSESPMDRLVCGDVGFGKTEVALRATFLAVLSGKQVAILVPTTTLAFQHYQTFSKRLSPFGVNVGMFSRFTSPKDVKTGFEDLAKGTMDVAIGTHKLLGKRVKFKDLGLLVIDEEHHFGVAQKERIKQLRAQVDVLAMTATPIPRTLNMAFSGIRDLSVINTPPEDRLAIRTYITQWDNDTLREALNRELSRGGQVFFISNRIRTLDSIAEQVMRLAPKAKFATAHGQMDAKQIEKIMLDFADHKVDILVATAIVGSGLDFPQANTIFINRADALGLAQLYQLRGRVGRAKRRAYSYLIVPGDKAITRDARKRLAVLRTFTSLGSGYKVAARDLEIRGAGNLLGKQQSGHISSVGFEMYSELLEQEIKRLKGEPVEERFDTEISLPIPAFLPEEYVGDVSQRLSIYKRMSDAPDLDAAASILDELRDRFGQPPEPVINLIKIMELKIRARVLMIKAIDGGPESVTYTFDARTPVQVSTLAKLATEEQDRFTLLQEGRLIEKQEEMPPARLIEEVKKTLQRLA